jgi:uncharacterized protein (DUF58 family)
MTTAELLKKVRKIEIKTRGLSHHFFSGGYQSVFKGQGMSFSEVRAYQFGDDVRNIDWNVTARTGEPHVKIFEEERELSVMLIADISGSSFWGSTFRSKQEFITELCATLAFSADNGHDKVGLLLFSDQVNLYLPPQKGRQHSLRIIRELLHVEASQRSTDLNVALQFLHQILKKRSVCFILSDFDAPDYQKALRVLSRRHDCIGLHCWDTKEREMPDMGLLEIEAVEGRTAQWVDTSNPTFRTNVTQQFDLRLQQTEGVFRNAGADFLSLRTDEDYIPTLLSFFARRMHLTTVL